MFHFSALLSKAEADAARARKSRPADPPQVELEPHAGSDCVADRVRRDLDEQMQRLKELLDHVESLEFEHEAATAEIISTPSTDSAAQVERDANPESTAVRRDSQADGHADELPTPPIAAAREHRGESETRPTVSHTTNCEIVLGNGVHSRPDDLACQSPEVAEQSVTPVVEPTPQKSDRPSGCRSSSSSCRRKPAKPAVPVSPGVVQEFSVAPSPSAVGPETGTEFPPASPGVADGYRIEERSELELMTPAVEVRYSGDAGSSAHGASHMVVVDQTNGGGVPVAPTPAERPAPRNPSQLAHRSNNLDLPRVRRRFTHAHSDRLSQDPPGPGQTQRPGDNYRGGSRTLNLLAACGGLLFLGTLVYLLGDLVSWFRSWQM